MTLWYTRPATSWETQALPIGNGALGVMVFGGVASERLQFNEKSLWTGGPGSQGYDFGNWTTPRPGAIAEVQARIDRDGWMSPDAVADRLGQPKSGFGAYQPFGDIFLDTDHSLRTEPSPSPSLSVAGCVDAAGYRRELSLREAVARVGYTCDGVVYSREYFASHPGNVIVGRLTASQPGKVSFTLRTSSPHAGHRVSVHDGRLTITGVLADNGMRYEAQIQVIVSGGSRTDGSDRITVSGADSAAFVLSAGTDYADTYPSYRGEDPHARVTSAVSAAAARSFDQLLAAHRQDYGNLFDRVQLDIGQQPPGVPTDELLRSYDGSSRSLEALFFAYGRYLLIASSREGSLPANLQGVWNNSTSPPWSGDYHVNINLQMNYWLAEQTNLAETAAPYDSFVKALVAPGRVTAREMFGSRGWVVHNETNTFGFTGVHDWATAFWFPEAAAWVTQQLYESYLFSGDLERLRGVYPVLREAALFWVDNLHVDPRDGMLVVSPSYSPEHGDFSAGASMSQQIVFDLFTNVLEAAAALGQDEPEVRQALGKLDPGLRVGSWGQLQEWKTDWDSPSDTHRHVSHLYALHPGRQMLPASPSGRGFSSASSSPPLSSASGRGFSTAPDSPLSSAPDSPLSSACGPGFDSASGRGFASAADVALRARGDGGTGWSKAWKINFWARLLDGDHALKMLGEQLRTSTLENLWDTHPPFQIDGNFGATSGMAEMLLQSHSGVIDVLPALPSAWASGSFTGLRARGNVTVDASWTAGTASQIVLHTGSAAPITVRNKIFNSRYRLEDAAGQPVAHTRSETAVKFTAIAGQSYRITESPS